MTAHMKEDIVRTREPLDMTTPADGERPRTDAAALDELCVNTVRALAIDAVERANSGHPGMPLGAAPAAYVLWARFLRHNPADPAWPDRDRFVLSAGHASMLLYSLLHLSGYDLPLQELKRFRQWGSRTPGHPEHGHTPGVETTTGPLGQGFGNAVGMAMAERIMAERFNLPDLDIVDHQTYVLCSDGDMMEGVSAEAASLAGHLGLGKLICLYDDNDVSIDVRQADLREDELPETDLALANIAAEAVLALSQRLRAARVITSGYLVSDDPELDGYRVERRVQDGGWAADLHVRR